MTIKRLVAFLVFLLSLPAFATTPAFVSSSQITGGTTGTQTSASINMQAGNTMLVFVAFYNGQTNTPHLCTTADLTAPCNGTNNGVTDSQSDTYTRLGIIQPNNSTCNGSGGSTACPFMEVWYTLSIATTNSSGSVSIHSTPTGTGTSPAILIQEYSGVSAVNLTNVATGSAASATSASLSIALTYANDVIVGAFGDHPNNTQSVNGCTARGTSIQNNVATVNLKSCDNTSATGGANVSVGMTFASAIWAGAAVELCTTSPCPASGVNNNVVIIN